MGKLLRLILPLSSFWPTTVGHCLLFSPPRLGPPARAAPFALLLVGPTQQCAQRQHSPLAWRSPTGAATTFPLSSLLHHGPNRQHYRLPRNDDANPALPPLSTSAASRLLHPPYSRRADMDLGCHGPHETSPPLSLPPRGNTQVPSYYHHHGRPTPTCYQLGDK